MGVVHLHLAKYGMGDDDAGGGLADEPVAASYVERRAVQRVRIGVGFSYRIGRNNGETCAERASMHRTVNSRSRAATGV